MASKFEQCKGKMNSMFSRGCGNGCRVHPVILQGVSLTASGFCVFFSIFSLVDFNILRLIINLYIMALAALVFVADLRAFAFFGYLKFVYTALGRGLVFFFIGLMMLTGKVFDIISGSVMAAVGIIYFILARAGGGVPKPCLQRNIEELPLNAELNFVTHSNGARTVVATSQPGFV
eukprot:Lankesteria_metandrocarpae@DN2104_c0_g1_i2.p1